MKLRVPIEEVREGEVLLRLHARYVWLVLEDGRVILIPDKVVIDRKNQDELPDELLGSTTTG